MKKLTIALFIILFFTVQSCKKNWICTCSGTVAVVGTTSTVTFSIDNATQSDAQKTCHDFDCLPFYNNQAAGAMSNVTSTIH